MSFVTMSGIKNDFLQFERFQGTRSHLGYVAGAVTTHSGENFALSSPRGCVWKICGKDSTGYTEEDFDEWETMYLRTNTKMEVLGIIEGWHYPVYESVVLLLSEQGLVYVYDTDAIHLAAVCLQRLFDLGVDYPGIAVHDMGGRYSPRESLVRNKGL